MMWAGAYRTGKRILPQRNAGGDLINIDSSIQPASNMGPAGEFASAVQRYEKAYAQQATSPVAPKEDVVEISSLAKLLSREDQAQGVRMALVEKAKAEIASGSYDNPQMFKQKLTWFQKKK